MSDFRRYVGEYVANWRGYEGPLGKKVALTLRNRAKALGSLKGCCGNRGEPGC